MLGRYRRILKCHFGGTHLWGVMHVTVIEDLGVPQELVQKQLEEALEEVTVSWKALDELQEDEKEQTEALIMVKTPLTSQTLAQFPSLKVIAVAFTGYGIVDLSYCKENQIQVFNVPAYSTDSVAELVLGLTISILRDIPKSNSLIRSGGWNLGFAGSDLSGKVVGIVGTGTIGLRTAELFKAFHCKLIGWSRTQREEFKIMDGQYVDSLETLFERADIISLHVPANEHTNGLISKDVLSKLRATSILINCARGAVVDQKALTEGLQNGKFRAGIDVFEEEPVSKDDPILQVDDRSILTPHIAYKTNEALLRRAQITVENLINFKEGRDTNRVDQ